MADTKTVEWQLLRLKTAFKVTADKDLAKSLDVSSQSVASAKKRGKISADWFIKAAEKVNASLDWLVYGTGNPYRS